MDPVFLISNDLNLTESVGFGSFLIALLYGLAPTFESGESDFDLRMFVFAVITIKF